VIEHGMGGARAAAPVAKDMMTYMFEPDKAMQRLQAMEAGWGGDPAVRLQKKINAWNAVHDPEAAAAAAEAVLKIPSWKSRRRKKKRPKSRPHPHRANPRSMQKLPILTHRSLPQRSAPLPHRHSRRACPQHLPPRAPRLRLPQRLHLPQRSRSREHIGSPARCGIALEAFAAHHGVGRFRLGRALLRCRRQLLAMGRQPCSPLLHLYVPGRPAAALVHRRGRGRAVSPRRSPSSPCCTTTSATACWCSSIRKAIRWAPAITSPSRRSRSDRAAVRQGLRQRLAKPPRIPARSAYRLSSSRPWPRNGACWADCSCCSSSPSSCAGDLA
jgi:hypothetical protein